MEPIEEALGAWKDTLCQTVDAGGLYSRNPIAHKWKATYRALLVREGVCWRAQDLLAQCHVLHKANHALGARILLRSAIETLSVLVYLNMLMRDVVAGTLNFHDFSDKTTQLALGSKDASTNHTAINILKMLDRADKRIPSIRAHYDTLSESAHPNFDGITLGYSKPDGDTFVTTFSNQWNEIFRSSHDEAIRLCIALFTYEYNTEWIEAFSALENWIVENDETLEATKRSVA